MKSENKLKNDFSPFSASLCVPRGSTEDKGVKMFRLLLKWQA